MEEEIRKQYETETGQRWCIIPHTHGENAYASWEYQLWLEKKVSQVEKPVILETAGMRKLAEKTYIELAGELIKLAGEDKQKAIKTMEIMKQAGFDREDMQLIPILEKALWQAYNSSLSK